MPKQAGRLVGLLAASTQQHQAHPFTSSPSSFSCTPSMGEGASIITSRPALFFGKAMNSRMSLRPPKSADPTVEAEGRAAVGRGTVLEGIHQEAELVAGILVGKAQHPEHGLLHGAVVDADAATTDLRAVDHQVVGVGLYRCRGRFPACARLPAWVK
jgi:hypothetical protein